MEATVGRKQTSFRLREDLLRKMQLEARKENRSLNNFVESQADGSYVLRPNETTLKCYERG